MKLLQIPKSCENKLLRHPMCSDDHSETYDKKVTIGSNKNSEIMV